MTPRRINKILYLIQTPLIPGGVLFLVNFCDDIQFYLTKLNNRFLLYSLSVCYKNAILLLVKVLNPGLNKMPHLLANIYHPSSYIHYPLSNYHINLILQP